MATGPTQPKEFDWLGVKSIPPDPAKLNLTFFNALEEKVYDVETRVFKGPLFTEEMMVPQLLLFANLRGQEFEVLVEDAITPYVTTGTDPDELERTIDSYKRDSRRHQEWVRTELQKIVDGTKSSNLPGIPGITKSIRPSDGFWTGGPVVFERFVGPNLVLERRYAFPSLYDFVVFAMLMARSERFSSLICKCRFKPCAKFFCAQETAGRTRRNFCSSKCENDERKRTAFERVAASRAGISVAEWREMHSAKPSKSIKPQKSSRKSK